MAMTRDVGPFWPPVWLYNPVCSVQTRFRCLRGGWEVIHHDLAPYHAGLGVARPHLIVFQGQILTKTHRTLSTQSVCARFIGAISKMLIGALDGLKVAGTVCTGPLTALAPLMSGPHFKLK